MDREIRNQQEAEYAETLRRDQEREERARQAWWISAQPCSSETGAERDWRILQSETHCAIS